MDRVRGWPNSFVESSDIHGLGGYRVLNSRASGHWIPAAVKVTAEPRSRRRPADLPATRVFLRGPALQRAFLETRNDSTRPKRTLNRPFLIVELSACRHRKRPTVETSGQARVAVRSQLPSLMFARARVCPPAAQAENTSGPAARERNDRINALEPDHLCLLLTARSRSQRCFSAATLLRCDAKSSSGYNQEMKAPRWSIAGGAAVSASTER